MAATLSGAGNLAVAGSITAGGNAVQQGLASGSTASGETALFVSPSRVRSLKAGTGGRSVYVVERGNSQRDSVRGIPADGQRDFGDRQPRLGFLGDRDSGRPLDEHSLHLYLRQRPSSRSKLHGHSDPEHGSLDHSLRRVHNEG